MEALSVIFFVIFIVAFIAYSIYESGNERSWPDYFTDEEKQKIARERDMYNNPEWHSFVNQKYKRIAKMRAAKGKLPTANGGRTKRQKSKASQGGARSK